MQEFESLDGAETTTLEASPPMIGMRQTDFDATLTQATARGEAAQVARFKAIGGDPRVKGKEAFALRLACEAPQMPADAVGAYQKALVASPGNLTARVGVTRLSAYMPAPASASAATPAADADQAAPDEAEPESPPDEAPAPSPPASAPSPSD